MNDTVDKLVIFLAKRDGIDKLVKTFQYVSKLLHWHIDQTHPHYADRAKRWEVASGLSRKAFRTGRFLTGFNALRRNPGPTATFRLLAVLSNAGEMVYFFFDHFLWLSRIGVIDEKLARRMSFISAFGESVGYVFFIISDFLMIVDGIKREMEIGEAGDEASKKSVKEIRGDRVMRLMSVAANLADLIIALADIEPNPFCNHAVTLGISGLVSAWADHRCMYLYVSKTLIPEGIARMLQFVISIPPNVMLIGINRSHTTLKPLSSKCLRFIILEGFFLYIQRGNNLLSSTNARVVPLAVS